MNDRNLAYVDTDDETHEAHYRFFSSVSSTGLNTSLSLDEYILEHISENSVKAKFNRLAEQWRNDTQFESSVTQMVLNDAYQQVIGMGYSVVSVILESLQQKPEYWFWALKAITNEDPVPDNDKGNIQAMCDHWIRWGQKNERAII